MKRAFAKQRPFIGWIPLRRAKHPEGAEIHLCEERRGRRSALFPRIPFPHALLRARGMPSRSASRLLPGRRFPAVLPSAKHREGIRIHHATRTGVLLSPNAKKNLA